MKALRYAALLGFAVPSPGWAQGKPERMDFVNGSEVQRSFALVSGSSVVTINGPMGGCGQVDALRKEPWRSLHRFS